MMAVVGAWALASTLLGACTATEDDAAGTDSSTVPSHASEAGGDGVLPAASEATLWLSAEELEELPNAGPAWDALVEMAEDDWDDPDLGDNGDDHDVHVLAGALVAARTSDAELVERVDDALDDVAAAEIGDVLPLARNLLGYVVAADLVGYRDESFRYWLRDVLDEDADGRAGIDSLRESAESDPSNHGTHARASVLAVGLYLDDDELVATMADRFHDWLGRSSEGFVWKERWWQADPDQPVGINPRGAERDGLVIDGVLPEEQRRSGRFTTEPERENYVWEALQGAVVTAELLARAGYPAWDWEDRALLRAFRWLHDVNDYPAKGDDRWQPWIVNSRYGTEFPTESPTSPGKNMGFADWTHAPDVTPGGEPTG